MEDFNNGLKEPEQTDLKRKSVDVSFIIGFLLLLVATFISTVSNVIKIGGIYSLRNIDSYNFGVLIAPIIFSVVLSAIIIIVSRKNRGRNLLIFGILAVVVGFSSFSNQIKESIDDRKKLDVAMDKIVSMSKDVVSQKGIVKEEITADKYGDYTPVLEVFQDTYLEVQEISKDNIRISDVMNDTSTFSKKTLSDLSRIKEKREELDETLEYIEMLGKKTKDLLERIRSRCENIDTDPHFKAGLNEGIKNSLYKSTDSINARLESMNNVIKNIGWMLEYLEKNQGEYTFEGENLVFFDDDHVNAYNKLVSEYDKAVDEYNKSIEAYESVLQEKLSNLENLKK